MSEVLRSVSRSYAKPALVIAGVALGAVLVLQLWVVLLDFKTATPFPGQFDYGEGIVWQQTLLMLGPRMYSPSHELPFIVFHYPPLYYLVVRVLMALPMDPLEAGRLVSVLSALASAAIVSALVLACLPRRPTAAQIAIAVGSGALMLLPLAVRTWGGLMRVDMLAIALGLGATLVAVRSGGRFWLLTAALLLGLASMFTKQTQPPAGLSIVLVGLLCWPRATIGAALVVFLAGAAGVGLLQAATHGFLQNIVGDNLNTYSWAHGIEVLWMERTSAPFVLVMGVGALVVLAEFRRRARFAQLRRGDPVLVARAVVVIHFILACLMAPTVFKTGSSNNYLLDLLTSGAVLIGVLLCEWLRQPLLFAATSVFLALATANLPMRHYHQEQFDAWMRGAQPVIDSIRAADKPVTSDNMVLVMRAGKTLVYEPAIAEQLIATKQWDPSALLQMIRDHGFAFVLCQEPVPKGGPVLAAALMAAYPRLELVLPGLYIRRAAADPHAGSP
jgi:hypothetical protein